jgi:MFS family permease
VARLAVLPFLGRLVERRGARFVLVRGAWAIVPLPVLWLVSDDFYYLLGVQLVAGSAWAALELSTMLALFEAVQDAERTRVLSVFNVANAAAVALGALAGAWIFSGLDGGSAGYAALFAVSTLGRLATIPLLRHAPAPEAHVAAEDVRLRTLAVRPSAGAIQRPILPTVEQKPADPPDQA